MSHPYQDLPKSAYWKAAVSDLNPLESSDLWIPKHPLSPDDQAVTFGSCFAQHLSRALIKNGFGWLDAEPGPEQASDKLKSRHNYGIFSARTGNIYTTKALRQWLEWAANAAPSPTEIWEKNGRFYDPFRPAIEPIGFASAQELNDSRSVTLGALRRAVRECSVFVFTLGLTEAWESRTHGYAYATCPGTNAGTFDPTQHLFVNYDYAAVQAELSASLQLLRRLNPGLRVLLTVSPVPLTATAAGRHVIVSSTYSKSVLRAVAGALADSDLQVDYFPSYEIITSPSFRGMFYNPNMRTVSSRGVAFVMEHFLGKQVSPRISVSAAPARKSPDFRNISSAPPALSAEPEAAEDETKCEEAMLAAFAPTRGE